MQPSTIISFIFVALASYAVAVPMPEAEQDTTASPVSLHF